MSHRTWTTRIAASAVLWVAIGGLEAQTVTVEEDPAPGGETPATATAPADAEAADGLGGLWDTVSPEEMEKLIQEAEDNRLTSERAKALAEIRDNLLYELDADKAAAVLESDKAADTRADNIRRIGRAFAIVDRRLAKARELYDKERFLEAAAEAKALGDPEETSYFNASAYLLQADALRAHGAKLIETGEPAAIRTGRKYQLRAVEVYGRLGSLMPERISFAVEATVRAGAVAEALDRYYYAMQAYADCLKNYGLTLPADEYEKLRLKVERWVEMYEEPLATAVDMMQGVEKRLKKYDSGNETQERGEQIVMLLEDLIKTAEENSGGGSSNSSQTGKKGKRKGQDKGQGQGQGKQGKQGGKGSGKSGPAQGTQKPSNPASVSALAGGAVQRPGKLSEVRTTRETGEWAKLPPRQRQEIEQMIQRRVSERAREQIREYLSSLAETSAEGR